MARNNSALMNYPLSVTGCTPTLPPIVATCQKKATTALADRVLIGSPDTPPFLETEWNDAALLDAAITLRVKQSGVVTIAPSTANAALRLVDIYTGNKPIVDAAPIKLPWGGSTSKETDHTLEWDDNDISIENSTWHDLMNGYSSLKFWYFLGDFMLGTRFGLDAGFASSHGFAASDGLTEVFKTRLSWSAKRVETKTIRPASY